GRELPERAPPPAAAEVSRPVEVAVACLQDATSRIHGSPTERVERRECTGGCNPEDRGAYGGCAVEVAVACLHQAAGRTSKIRAPGEGVERGKCAPKGELEDSAAGAVSGYPVEVAVLSLDQAGREIGAIEPVERVKCPEHSRGADP